MNPYTAASRPVPHVLSGRPFEASLLGTTSVPVSLLAFYLHLVQPIRSLTSPARLSPVASVPLLPLLSSLFVERACSSAIPPLPTYLILQPRILLLDSTKPAKEALPLNPARAPSHFVLLFLDHPDPSPPGLPFSHAVIPLLADRTNRTRCTAPATKPWFSPWRVRHPAVRLSGIALFGGTLASGGHLAGCQSVLPCPCRGLSYLPAAPREAMLAALAAPACRGSPRKTEFEVSLYVRRGRQRAAVRRSPDRGP